MMSVIETIHCGKPIVAIPIFGDQIFNSHLLVEKQVAVIVEYKHLESDQLFNAINEALTEKYMYGNLINNKFLSNEFCLISELT
jgi:UDP:flavonoid glycosyltransferase YjiC (YdhE family)